MNVKLSGGSRSFEKEMRDLKMKSIKVGHRKLTTIPERIMEADLLQLHEKLLKNSMPALL